MIDFEVKIFYCLFINIMFSILNIFYGNRQYIKIMITNFLLYISCLILLLFDSDIKYIIEFEVVLNAILYFILLKPPIPKGIRVIRMSGLDLLKNRIIFYQTYEVFKSFLESISDFNYGNLSNFLSHKLYEEYKAEYDYLRNSGNRKIISDLKKFNMFFIERGSNVEYEYEKILIWVEKKEDVVNNSTNEIVEGDNKKRQYMYVVQFNKSGSALENEYVIDSIEEVYRK